MLQYVTAETLTFERWSWQIHVVALISQRPHLQYLTMNMLLIAPVKKVEILHLSTPPVHATCPRHLSTQVSLRPVPVAGLCGPGVTCFPVGLPSGAGGQVYLSWLYPPYGHVCDDRLRFDPLDRSMSFSWVSPELHIDAPPAVPYFCFPV